MIFVFFCLTEWQSLGPSMLLVVAQLLSHVWLFVTPWIAAHHASLSFTVSQSLLRFMSIESVMLANYLIFCCPLLLLPSVFPLLLQMALFCSFLWLSNIPLCIYTWGFPDISVGKESIHLQCRSPQFDSFLGWEDPLEKGPVTHSSVLAWRSPRTV